MKKMQQLIAISIIATTLVTPSLFADRRNREETPRYDAHRRDGRRVSLEGRIRHIERERNGFVIVLDRGRHTLFANANTDVRSISRVNGRRQRVRDLERGDFIRVTGVRDSGSYIYVDEIDLLREDDARQLSGIVQDVDRRRDELVIREARSGRVIVVEARRARGRDLDDLRRGDYVTLVGEWERNGRFEADRIHVRRDRW